MRIVLASFFSFALFVSAAESNPALENALRPLLDGVPEVAVTRLQQLLAVTPPQSAGPVTEKLAEALLAAQRPEEALQTLGNPASAEGKFLRARALLELQRPAEALVLLEEIRRTAPENRAVAFLSAQTFRQLGREEEALANFRALERDQRFSAEARLEEVEILLNRQDRIAAKKALDLADPKATAQKRQKRLLRARWELLAHQPERAANLLESLVGKTEGVAHATIVAALFAMADAHLQLGTPEAGDDFLENFIDRHPHDETLPGVFEKLAQVYRAEKKPPRLELERWTRDEAQPRRGLAHWYLAQFDLAAGRGDSALRHFEELRRAPSVSIAPALLQYARLLLKDRRNDEARALLDSMDKIALPERLRRAVADERGQVDYSAARFAEAARTFASIPGGRTPAPLYNAALAWMQSGESAQADAAAQQLRAVNDPQSATDLLLEGALLAAQKSDPTAARKLQEFLAQNPKHPRAAEANVALAELAFRAQPAQLPEAEKYLAAARASNPSDPVRERADYLAVWLADARGVTPDQLIAVATEFLRAHPGSAFTADVRLKLGETHFRRQDFANAETQFEQLAQENPNSSLTEKALFLAAQSATSTMAPRALDHALDLLAQVIKRDGEFRWSARNEQAAVARRLGKLSDAQLLYDEVLKGDARPAEKREALCGKADLLAEEASRDPTKIGLAIDAYDQLAQESANQPSWRNQALFKKGVCQEKETPDAALATFYRVLEFNPQPDRAPEFFWFYKAGFNAARLLEAQEKWQSAAAIYDRLAGVAGPRSEEAKARLAQLRLEHFLW